MTINVSRPYRGERGERKGQVASGLGTAAEPAGTSIRPRRYAVVGTGGRAGMFIQPLATSHRSVAALVAFCDINPDRMALYNRRLGDEWNHPPVPTFSADQFDRMVSETRPDVVIVCTVDYLHDDYAVRAMELGCDVVVEKPVAVTAEKCRRILQTQARTGRRVQVTHNCRFMPWAVRIKELLVGQVIGEIIEADCEWMLDARKGVTYFARWHAEKEKSGGLMVHKASHHLDLMNWWLDAVPQTVYGVGRRAFFGAENKAKHGITATNEYYLGSDSRGDPFAPRSGPLLAGVAEMNLAASRHDGYRGDRSVWRDHDISAEDTMSILVRYRTGTAFTYRLNAFLPRIGCHIVLNGTRGRLEYHHEPGGRVVPNGEVALPPPPPGAEPVTWESRLIVHPLFGEAYSLPVPTADGCHDGGDPVLIDRLFGPERPDPLGQTAGAAQAVAAALIGAGANRSFETGQPVELTDLCPELGLATRLSELA